MSTGGLIVAFWMLNALVIRMRYVHVTHNPGIQANGIHNGVFILTPISVSFPITVHNVLVGSLSATNVSFRCLLVGGKPLAAGP